MPRAPWSFVVGFLVGCSLLAAPFSSATATSERDLRGRIVIDGYTSDFKPDEATFGLNPDGSPQETANDSSNGPEDDIGQVRVTWDRKHLYLAGEGMIWDQNMILLIDLIDDRGFTTMRSLNSWMRLIDFGGGFEPDLCAGTWDMNDRPRLLIHLFDSFVRDETPGPYFKGASTFEHGNTGRAMELAIPWSTVFLFAGGVVERDTTISRFPDTLVFIPPGTTLRLAGVVTWGPDRTGGVDVAPNSSQGTSGYPWDLLLVDNYAILPIDLDVDGLPDMGVEIQSRVKFHDHSLPVRATSWGRIKRLYR